MNNSAETVTIKKFRGPLTQEILTKISLDQLAAGLEIFALELDPQDFETFNRRSFSFVIRNESREVDGRTEHSGTYSRATLSASNKVPAGSIRIRSLPLL